MLDTRNHIIFGTVLEQARNDGKYLWHYREQDDVSVHPVLTRSNSEATAWLPGLWTIPNSFRLHCSCCASPKVAFSPMSRSEMLLFMKHRCQQTTKSMSRTPQYSLSVMTQRSCAYSRQQQRCRTKRNLHGYCYRHPVSGATCTTNITPNCSLEQISRH